MGWKALERWGDDAVRLEPLTGRGGVNEVWSVRVDGRRTVGRLGRRGDADLGWETDLLRHLGRAGVPVPVPLPTTDGRHFADGLVVMTHVAGGPPTQSSPQARASSSRLAVDRGWSDVA